MADTSTASLPLSGPGGSNAGRGDAGPQGTSEGRSGECNLERQATTRHSLGPPTPLHSFRLFRDSAADALTGLKGSTKVRHHHSRACSPASPTIARFRDSASPFARSHSRLSSFGRSRAWLNGRRAMATSLMTKLAKSGTLAATAWAVKPLLVRVTSRGLGSGLAL